MDTFIYILYILLAIVVLLFMVLVHELGHYIAGRILKFKITEFSIGFGKAIFKKTNKRGEVISLRIFPLGGFCSFSGEGDTEDGPPAEGSFNSFAPWKRIIVFLAGVTMNFITAIVFSVILLGTVGGRDIVQVTNVKEDYSSSIVLNEGDVIYKLGDYKLDLGFGSTYNEAFQAELTNAKTFEENSTLGEKITDYRFTAEIRRADGTYETVNDMRFFEYTEVDTEGNEVKKYTMGITVEYYVHTLGESLGRCWSYSFGLSWMILKSLWQLITFQIPINSIGGPITTITTIATASRANFSNIFLLIPLLSANLGVFNLLPIPALDGSHVIFTLIEWIRKKPIKRKVENMIHTIGLLTLLAFVVVVDILHFVL